MFESLFGSEMPLAARFFIAFLIVLALIGLTAWLVRRFGSSRLGTTARGRQPRLAVIDAATVDGRRRLVLIRRDNIEHLLLSGGPTDIVIEPNIVRAVGAREVARDATRAALIAGQRAGLRRLRPLLAPARAADDRQRERHGGDRDAGRHGSRAHQDALITLTTASDRTFWQRIRDGESGRYFASLSFVAPPPAMSP